MAPSRDPLTYRIDTIQHALERLTSTVQGVSAVVDVLQGQETPSDDRELARARAARLSTLEAQVRELLETVGRLTDTMESIVKALGSIRTELGDLAAKVADLEEAVRRLVAQPGQ